MDNERLNEKRYNNFGSEMIIVAYRGCMDIDIYFPKYDYIVKNRRYDDFRDGKVICYYEPRTYGVGYYGYGKYNNLSNEHKKCYSMWSSMLNRCYNEKYQIKKPSYIGCEVCEEWHNFQNFAEWFYDNYYEIDNEEMHLDKDILHKGNKIYSPQNCIIVPKRINSLFTKSDRIRGEYPIGVTIEKRTNHFRARCMILNENDKNIKVNIGNYKTVEEAFHNYKKFKESYIKQVAEQYKDKIPYELYKSMYEYEVDIND